VPEAEAEAVDTRKKFMHKILIYSLSS